MLGLYVSIPFCKFKCTYCNFASGVFPRAELERYLAALEKEILKPQASSLKPSADTLYLGGGTPSMLSGEQLRKIFRALRETFEITPTEITLEAAPATFDDALVRTWVECGVNRVSLGVQSFVERELRAVARPHSAQGVADDINRLRRAGIRNISVDLIAGLPYQTRESWEQSLDWVAQLGPEHVSVYLLEIDQDSRLGAEALAGGARYSAAAVPEEDTMACLYLRAAERLDELGYRQYEISNFALPGRESRHNVKYWEGRPYLGFGVDAHSYDGNERSANVDSVEEYVGRLERGESPVAMREAVDERRREQERLFLGLRRTAGVTLTERDRERYGGEISHLAAAGLLEFSGGRLRLTPRGRLLSNEVFQAFV